MKVLYAIGLGTLLLGSLGSLGFANSPSITSIESSEPALVCDVVNEDFCFALASGATSTLSVPVDFKLYEVTLRGDQKIFIYYGSHPDYPDHAEPAFSDQVGLEKTSLYSKEIDGVQHVDAFYEKRREKFVSAVHVRAEFAPADEPAFLAFLRGMRKCDSDRKDLVECKSELLFAKIVEHI